MVELRASAPADALPASSGGEPTGIPRWEQIHRRVTGLRPTERSGADLDALADALFWLDRPDDSMVVRRDAYAAHKAADALADAAKTAWRLFYDHFLIGESAIANGWLRRARLHAEHLRDPEVPGWLAIAEADLAIAEGRLEQGASLAAEAVRAARHVGEPNLVAMALQTSGRALIELGHRDDGLAELDEAMIAVAAGELQPMYTGWVFCNLLSTCHGLADLRRASEWTDAAIHWCEALEEGRFYPGICRVHAVELALLRGDWSAAEVDCRRACDELTAHDPRFAGEAFYVAGELCRLGGDLDGAQEAFARARELGRDPQPGLARVRLAQHRPAAAVKGLRLALGADPSPLLHRALLLAACVESEVALGDLDAAEEVSVELAALAERDPVPFLVATSAAATGAVRLAIGDATGARTWFRRACATFQALGVPYEMARSQVGIATAARLDDDEETADQALRAALSVFDQLGADPDARRVRASLGAAPTNRVGLTGREVEVLRLVAQGHTNRSIGIRLVISEHTVARHVSNIFTKLGVTSRAAATAHAFEHDLV